jgi:acid phosphatase class B
MQNGTQVAKMAEKKAVVVSIAEVRDIMAKSQSVKVSFDKTIMSINFTDQLSTY